MPSLASYRLPEGTHIDYAHLRVKNFQKALAFYKGLLNLTQVQRQGSTISLSPTEAGKPILMLTERPDAIPRPTGSTGLFHIAIRVPNRRELAKLFIRLSQQRYPFQGFADHGVSEALYLADPDGNGLEVYADKPRTEWTFVNGELQMGTWHLDLDSLLSAYSDNEDDGLHPATDIGHIHLNVSDLSKAERFYADTLGFDVVQRNYPGALFVSAGGYHHHIGLNTWSGPGAPPPPQNAVGLIRFGIALPDDRTRTTVQERLRTSEAPLLMTNGTVIARDQDRIEIEIL